MDTPTWGTQHDGVDHVNVYSKGKTDLGRWLSNFYQCRFTGPDGTFWSVEGYWYWLKSTHPDRDELRRLYGYSAKKKGRELADPNWVETPVFRWSIGMALWAKVMGTPHIRQALAACELPLAHYYVYGGVAKHAGHEWIIEYLERIRIKLQEQPEPTS